MRGFLYGKDAEVLIREVTKVFDVTVAEFLDRDYNIGEVRQNVYERTLRAIRRISGKEPMVLPLLIEID